MVIELEFKMEDLYKSCTDTECSLFLEALSIKILKGCHIFLGGISLFKKMSENTKISENARNIFSLQSRRITYMAEYRKSPIKVVLTTDKPDVVIGQERKNFTFNVIQAIKENLWEFALSDSVVVFEKISDDLIYSKILEYIKFKENLNIHLNYTARHGGGNETSVISKNEITRGFNTFCICDSDRKHDKSALGQTAQRVKKVFQEHDRLDFLYIIEVQEIENLIPGDIYHSTAINDQKKSTSFIKFLEDNHPDHLLCYDIKNAHPYAKVFLSNDDFSSFWQTIYLNPIFETHITAAHERYNNEQNKETTILPKLSSMCNAVKQNFLSKEHHEIVISERLLDEWNIIFEKFKIWCIASPPVRL